MTKLQTRLTRVPETHSTFADQMVVQPGDH
jgi:hypothetical protein